MLLLSWDRRGEYFRSYENILNTMVLLLIISRLCVAVFDIFKAWETDYNVCLPDLPEKLPHLEVYERALPDKSKQQPSLH